MAIFISLGMLRTSAVQRIKTIDLANLLFVLTKLKRGDFAALAVNIVGSQ